MSPQEEVVDSGITNKTPIHLKNIPVYDPTLKLKPYWRLIIFFGLLHVFLIYGIFNGAMWQTYLFNFFLHLAFLLGVTGGVHRLWSHRAYKVKLPTEIFLMILNTAAFQGPILKWARDHRLHHKYTDTEADPYNNNRGFFYSHIGWVLSKKTKYVREKLSEIDISDLINNPVVAFQNKYYFRMVPVLTFIIPTIIPVLMWKESALLSFCICCLRHAWTAHDTFFVNSIAHSYGYKPYDNTISPGESKLLSFIGNGEGFHNYHHAFPRDYKTSEFPYYPWSLTTSFIDFISIFGQAYNMNSTPKHIIEKRSKRTGDGSWPISQFEFSY